MHQPCHQDRARFQDQLLCSELQGLLHFQIDELKPHLIRPAFLPPQLRPSFLHPLELKLALRQMRESACGAPLTLTLAL